MKGHTICATFWRSDMPAMTESTHAFDSSRGAGRSIVPDRPAGVVHAVVKAAAPTGARLLPLNRSLLRRVDILADTALEEKGGHVVREERAGLGIHHVEPVMIDQHRLLLEPITPALLADLLDHTGPDLPRKGGPIEPRAGLTASRASHIRHTVRDWTLTCGWIRSSRVVMNVPETYCAARPAPNGESPGTPGDKLVRGPVDRERSIPIRASSHARTGPSPTRSARGAGCRTSRCRTHTTWP